MTTTTMKEVALQSGIEAALEDVRCGRVHAAENSKDLMRQTTK